MKVIRIVFLSALLLSFTGVVQAQTWWGALAFNGSTGIAGGAWNYSSRAGATDAALNACIKKHKGQVNNCKILTSFSNGCAAVYWDPNNKKGGFGTSDYSVEQAKTRGYQSCIKYGGVECEHRFSFCTSLIIY